MSTRTRRTAALFATTFAAAALTVAGPAQATQIPNPNTQYRLDSYHAGNIHGEVVGQYAYDGPCGSAFWWGDTSSYVTTSWVTCPGK
jgi:hypothetical protein